MRRRKKNKTDCRKVVISLFVSAAVLIFGLQSVETVHGQQLFEKLIWPLLRLLFFIGIGLVAGQAIEASGWTRILAMLAMPAFRFGNLGARCSAAFTTAFFSGVAANAMLLEFYKEDRIDRKQLFLSNFVNQLPAFFLHLPTTFFIVIPLTGWAGGLYFLITFVAVIFRTVLFLTYGHLRLEPSEDRRATSAAGVESNRKTGRPAAKRIWEGIKKRLPRRLINIAVFVVPIYTAVFFLNALGIFDQLRQWLAGYVSSSVVPVESLSIVVLSFAAEFTSGFAAAGALLDAGVLTVKQTVLALLIGNVTAFPIRALRHQLPHYMGIYSPKTGLQLILMGQGFRILSILITGTVYYAFF
jgi:hypothetical protein